MNNVNTARNYARNFNAHRSDFWEAGYFCPDSKNRCRKAAKKAAKRAVRRSAGAHIADF